MMGHRGVRLGITFPEITEMQIRAILESTAELRKARKRCYPEIMIPVTCHANELKEQKAICDRVCSEVKAKYKLKKLEHRRRKTMQIGFYFDQSRCTGCDTCIIACKDWHDVPAGPASWMRVIANEKGKYPNPSLSYLINTCFHCAEPPCLPACPVGAITKREEDGIVVVNKENCTGCGICYDACPYGVPQFGIDRIMQKCDFCIESGGEPACTSPCPANALFYGTIEELARLAKESGAEILTGETNPSLYIRNQRKVSIPHDLLRLPG